MVIPRKRRNPQMRRRRPRRTPKQSEACVSETESQPEYCRRRRTDRMSPPSAKIPARDRKLVKGNIAIEARAIKRFRAGEIV